MELIIAAALLVILVGTRLLEEPHEPIVIEDANSPSGQQSITHPTG